jgi:hypothetical protein
MPSWTRARIQMLAVKDREAKRAKAEEERNRKRVADHLAMRRDYEDATRRSRMLEMDTKRRREDEARLEEERRAEARRQDKERLDKMAPSVFEEVWDVFG